MECPFVVGDQVVCISGHWKRHASNTSVEEPEFPIKGNIYTVASLLKAADDIFVSLAELRPTRDGPAQFIHDGFRKTKRTDISIFQEIARQMTDRVGSASYKFKTGSGDVSLPCIQH